MREIEGIKRKISVLKSEKTRFQNNMERLIERFSFFEKELGFLNRQISKEEDRIESKIKKLNE